MADIPRIRSGLVGNLPIFCNSGKADPLARDENGEWARFQPGAGAKASEVWKRRQNAKDR